MDMITVLKHLIEQEACFPALKLVWDDQIDVDGLGDLPKLTPSHYMNENRLTTDERHKLLCRQQKKMICRTPGAEVVVEPPIIVFQNYKFGESYTFPIVVRNISKNSQKVALLMDESYVFKFDECSQRVAKFPCGMCITATVTFTPESAMEDYYHKLVVSTNTKKVAVPIIGIGTRPLLNAPDSLILSDAPVRHWTVKPVTLLNIGKKTARFTLTVKGPFCVKPEKGVVPPNTAFTFDVAHYSGALSVNEGEVCIKYENGEEIYIYLRANAINCNIKLSSPDFRCEDTFMGLQTKATFFIENNSDITARFYWKEFEQAPEGSQGAHRRSVFSNTESVTEPPGEMIEEALEQVLMNNAYTPALQIEEDLLKFQEGPDHLFHNDNFNVYPLFGEVKPNSKTEIHLVFSPTTCAFFEGLGYLDISGVDKRLPFKFYGRGLGPKFRIAFEVLCVGDVTMGGTHTYELPVNNVSEIPGTMQCNGQVGLPTGMEMKVEPQELDVAPGAYGAFYVNFLCSGKPGPFEDEIKFSAKDTGDAFYVTVKGNITYPSIRFTTAEAHMGNLGYGFTKTFSIPLVNDSMNFVQVELKMETDGTDPHIDFNTILKSFKNHKFKFTTNPAEFKIHPQKFTLRPKGVQRIQLTMYPNQVRETKNQLKCWITDMDGNDVETVASINIRGTVIVPELRAVKPHVILKECYLQFPYEGEFIVKNPTELPAMYCVILKPTNNLKIESKSFVGVAAPWVETKIPFSVICLHPGDSFAHFDFYAVGHDEKLFELGLEVESIPSKVEASTKTIDFGHVKCLEEKICTVDLINTSPLNFPFTATLYQDEPSDKGDTWTIQPTSGELPSQSKVTLEITLVLKEVGWHYANVRVNMNEPLKHTIDIKMKALGVGSPLVFTPVIDKSATLNFGTMFIKQERYFEYDITNQGVNSRVIEWKHLNDKAPQNKLDAKGQAPQTPAKSEPKSETDKLQLHNIFYLGYYESVHFLSLIESVFECLRDTPKKSRPTFTISPLRSTIPPGGSVKLLISAFSLVQKEIEDTMNLWTYVPVSKGHTADDRTDTPPRTRDRGRRGQQMQTQNTKRHKPPPSEPADLHLRPKVLHEFKLHAAFEAPGLKFSRKSLHFIIEATPVQENYVMIEIVKIENVGKLPFRVKIRTKFPFSFYLHNDEDPMEEETYDFETHQSMIFKVQFDGRHLRKELGVVTFDGRLEAVYEGLSAIPSIDLHGEVRFPQLKMDKNLIDFGTITNGMEAVEQITVTNPGSFCLTYKWYIKPLSSTVHRNNEPEWAKELHFDSYKPARNNHLMLLQQQKRKSTGQAVIPSTKMDEKRKSRSLSAMGSRDHFAQILGFNSGAFNENSSNYQDFTQFIKEKMYRSRMMEFIGLKDAEFEAEDEVNYLAFYNQNAMIPKEEFSTNEIIDVIPLAGVVQAGQSQTFTVVFYGHPDITFKTTLVLYIEGGARQNVEVTGTTIHPTPIDKKAKALSKSSMESSATAASFAQRDKDEDKRLSKSQSLSQTAVAKVQGQSHASNLHIQNNSSMKFYSQSLSQTAVAKVQGQSHASNLHIQKNSSMKFYSQTNLKANQPSSMHSSAATCNCSVAGSRKKSEGNCSCSCN